MLVISRSLSTALSFLVLASYSGALRHERSRLDTGRRCTGVISVPCSCCGMGAQIEAAEKAVLSRAAPREGCK